MKNRKMNLNFGPSFSRFFTPLQLMNDLASDGNILDVNIRGCEEEFQGIYNKIANKHIADITLKVMPCS